MFQISEVARGASARVLFIHLIPSAAMMAVMATMSAATAAA